MKEKRPDCFNGILYGLLCEDVKVASARHDVVNIDNE
jgi:hypothetical protein